MEVDIYVLVVGYTNFIEHKFCHVPHEVRLVHCTLVRCTLQVAFHEELKIAVQTSQTLGRQRGFNMF